MNITFNADEVGTRIEHMAELHKIWGNTLHILLMRQGSLETDANSEKIKKLEDALELLENYMTISYSDAKYASEIDNTVQLPLADKAVLGLPEEHRLPEPKSYEPYEGTT